MMGKKFWTWFFQPYRLYFFFEYLTFLFLLQVYILVEGLGHTYEVLFANSYTNDYKL